MTASIALVAAVMLIAACAPGPERGAGAAREPGVSGSPGRVLNIAFRYPVAHLIPKISTPAAESTQRWFNAALTLNDNTGSLRPFLAEDLPQLNTDSWRVFPEGRMETTYRLRPGLTWHDGQTLSAEDFVFAWRVYTNPSLGEFTSSPQHLMEAVVANDPRTLVIRWRGPYPNANSIQMGDLDPLPRHILDQRYDRLEETGPDAFLSLSYWLSEYIGAGPYRLVRSEPGSHFEGEAFDAYVLGRPKIDRIVLRLISDETTQLTNLLAGSVDFANMRFEHAQVALRDWVPAGKGTVVFNRGGPISMYVQQRPEFVGHQALLDVRVRRAIAHSLDRQGINDGVFDGQGFVTETMVPETEPFYPEVDRAIMHYPYDLRRTEQLMNEAGFSKDRDGFFANVAAERYSLDFVTVAGPEFERIQLVLTDAWGRAGIEVQASILTGAQLRDTHLRHTLPGIATRGGSLFERTLTGADVGTAENRWTGSNFGGWSNAEYDRLYEAFVATLDRAGRTRQFVQMQRLLSDHLPLFVTHFAISADMHAAGLHVQGEAAGSAGTGTFTRGTSASWNIHEWTWQ